jgi:hypothetical protein
MRRKHRVMIAILLAGMLVACTPSQEQQWLQLVGVLVSAVPNIIPLLTSNPSAASAANEAVADYNTAQTLLQGYQASAAGATTTLQKVSAALNDAETNLDSILTAAHVSDAATQMKIQAAVNLAITVTQELISSMPSSTAATIAHVTLPKPANVQNQFNSIFAK